MVKGKMKFLTHKYAQIARFITSMRVCYLGLLVCALVATLLANFCTAVPSQELLFNFSPLQDPVKTYVRVSRQGHAQALYYTSLVVIEAFEGDLPANITRRLFSNTNSLAFKFSWLNYIFPSNVVMEGDLFSIILTTEGRPIEETGGFAHLAPKVISSQISQFLAVVNYLKRIPLAASYLESSPILPKQRFALLQSEDKLQSFSTLPKGLQQILRLAIDRPLTFVALDKAQYQQFLSYKTGLELLLNKQGNGYEVHLYTTKSNHLFHKIRSKTP